MMTLIKKAILLVLVIVGLGSNSFAFADPDFICKDGKYAYVVYTSAGIGPEYVAKIFTRKAYEENNEPVETYTVTHYRVLGGDGPQYYQTSDKSSFSLHWLTVAPITEREGLRVKAATFEGKIKGKTYKSESVYCLMN